MNLYDRIAPHLGTSVAPEEMRPLYLCTAIKYAYNRGDITTVERDALLDKILTALGGCNETVFHWLYSRGYIESHWTSEYKYQQVQLYRHRWLKHLCEEYENAI